MSIYRAAGGAPPRTVRRPRLTRERRRTVWFFIFIAPFLFGLFVLTLFPIGYGFYMSLTNYDGLNIENTRFIGLENYRRAFQDPGVATSVGQTLKWVAMNVPTWTIFSFALALLLNRDLRGGGVLRTLFYLPTVIPAVAVVVIWKVILDQNSGLLNGLISLFQPGTAIPWLGKYALPGLLAASVWAGLGWGMVVFLAGLQGIPQELIEAARIDGANSWQLLQRVTLPLVSPVLFFQLVMVLINSFQQLIYPLLMASALGGASVDTPGTNIPNAIYFFMVFTYTRIRGNFYGYGLALLWLLFVTVVILALLLFWSERFWVYRGDMEEQDA